MNKDFLRSLITDEMHKASFQMHHLKAQGPDEIIYS